MATESCRGCREYQQLSRRQFLYATGGAAVAASVPAWLPRVTFAQDFCSNRDVIVSIFLRGAADGLTLCVPHGEDRYYAARPTLAIPRPDSGDPNRATDLDGFFGLAPAMTPLLTAYGAGDLLLVHACGSTDSSRSHFDAQRFMEVGKPDDASLFTGWLGRHLASTPPSRPDAILRAVGIGYGLQRTLDSAPLALPIPDLDAFGLTGNAGTAAARRETIAQLYDLVGDPLRAAGATTLQTIDLLNTINFAGYVPEAGAVYPAGSFGTAMRSVAALIKADVGVEAVAIDLGGWDTHNNQGVTGAGAMATLMGQLSGALAAFHLDMFGGNAHKNVTVVCMSEFGRRLDENGSIGTDHGHGNAMLVLGNHIAGGRVLSQWPGLDAGELFEGRDLQVTTDFRDVLAEIVQKRLGNSELGYVFPDYSPTFRGVTEACGPGDTNCDGSVDNGDVDSFVLALTDRDAYQAANPTCNVNAADANGDGAVDNGDIDAFVDVLLNPP